MSKTPDTPDTENTPDTPEALQMPAVPDTLVGRIARAMVQNGVLGLKTRANEEGVSGVADFLSTEVYATKKSGDVQTDYGMLRSYAGDIKGMAATMTPPVKDMMQGLGLGAGVRITNTDAFKLNGKDVGVIAAVVASPGGDALAQVIMNQSTVSEQKPSATYLAAQVSAGREDGTGFMRADVYGEKSHMFTESLQGQLRAQGTVQSFGSQPHVMAGVGATLDYKLSGKRGLSAIGNAGFVAKEGEGIASQIDAGLYKNFLGGRVGAYVGLEHESGGQSGPIAGVRINQPFGF